MTLVNIVAVFCATIIVEALWTMAVVETARRRALIAALYSAFLPLVAGYTTISFIRNPLMLVVIAVGAFVGTFVTLKLMR